MAIQLTDDGDYITYTNGKVTHRVSRMALVHAAFVAREWHSGQWSALYSLSCGNFDYETIGDAASELARAIEKHPPSESDDTWRGDADMQEAQTALEELESALSEDLIQTV